MAEAYIAAALRTAGGKRNGRLRDWHPADLGGRILDALVTDTGIDPAAIEDVIMGCVSQVGQQSFHIGRNCVLASSLPDSVPAVGIDRQCGSSQQSVHFAAQAVMSGVQDLVIAAGVESMTRVPMLTAMTLPEAQGLGSPWSEAIRQSYGVTEFSQFTGAEMMAKKYGLKREALDAFAVASHRKAHAATESGAFDLEIVPLVGVAADGTTELHCRDEGVRSDATIEGVASVKALRPDGTTSAANASQICDGAAGILIASERALRDHHLTPLARIHAMTVTAGDPVIMLDEPIHATRRALARAGMTIDQIGQYEVNEAFACVPLAWLQATGADPSRLNVNGGSIALGHPLGATGAKLMATLVHSMRAGGQRFGLQTMCEAGGIANVTIIEAL
ncbi:acetyl-CoA C-acetyltransferase [Brevundimonas diminuta]|uniref:acetyl-CoA C-acetyltransferase n=1 Tax=Brevundimonas diminuta TaxID=293 RepID=UPI0032094167